MIRASNKGRPLALARLLAVAAVPAAAAPLRFILVEVPRAGAGGARAYGNEASAAAGLAAAGLHLPSAALAAVLRPWAVARGSSHTAAVAGRWTGSVPALMASFLPPLAGTRRLGQKSVVLGGGGGGGGDVDALATGTLAAAEGWW